MSTRPSRARVITLWRPWPALILAGHKPIENRTWSTQYRGPLVIHAGRHFNYDAADLAESLGVPVGSLRNPLANPRGHVGVVDLIDVCTDRTSGDVCGCGPWAIEGQCHWRLANPRTFSTPIAERGAQGIWVSRDPLVLVQAFGEPAGGTTSQEGTPLHV